MMERKIYYMNCKKCGGEFEEKELQSSHDIPKYIGGTDKDGRHWLCKECHEKYEKYVWCHLASKIKTIPEEIKKEFREIAKKCAIGFFK